MSSFRVSYLKAGDVLLKKIYANLDRRVEYIVVKNIVDDVIYIQ